MAKAGASQIPQLLPKLLHCIRMIWNTSSFYNTPERISGLLRKARRPPWSCPHLLGT